MTGHADAGDGVCQTGALERTERGMCNHCGHAEHGAQPDGTGPNCGQPIDCETYDETHPCACPNW
jgi:hypothetical protein